MTKSKYLYLDIYEKLIQSIKNNDADEEGYLLSESAYCKKFNVSLTTVRRALEQMKDEGIIEKVKGKGSLIRDNVRSIGLPHNKYVGVLMVPFSEQPSIYVQKYKYLNNYSHKIYKSIYNGLNNDYNLLLDTIDECDLDSKFSRSVLNQTNIIFLVGEVKKNIIEFLQNAGKCVIVYNYFDFDVRVCRINNDEREKFCQAVEYYIGKGHEHIAVINGLIDYSESIERFMGYQDALIKHDHFVDSLYIKWGNMTPESGYYLGKELMKLMKPPTVIVCVNDGVAMGAYDAITEAGFLVPNDVILIGHDNASLSKQEYSFTTIDPKYELIGEIITQKIKRNIWIDDVTIVPGDLIIR